MANIIDTSSPGHCRFVECREPIFWIKIAGNGIEPFDPPEPCERCAGRGGGVSGSIVVHGQFEDEWEPCSACAGKGKIQKRHIPHCLGMQKAEAAR